MVQSLIPTLSNISAASFHAPSVPCLLAELHTSQFVGVPAGLQCSSSAAISCSSAFMINSWRRCCSMAVVRALAAFCASAFAVFST